MARMKGNSPFLLNLMARLKGVSPALLERRMLASLHCNSFTMLRVLPGGQY